MLFEMLTGQRAFGGTDVTETLAAVIMKDPDWRALPETTPAALQKLLRRCLEKDRRQRLADIADARLEIDEARRAPEEHAALEPTTAPPTRSRERQIGIVAAAVLAIAVLALAIPTIVHFREAPTPARALRASVPLPDNSSVALLELSPDGRRLLLVLFREGKSQIYLRPLDSDALQPLSGTDNARSPFWSPDSRFIGFFADNKLKVVPAAGGPAQVLCGETGLGAGGTWNRNGVILFAYGPPTVRLQRVAAKGGSCSAVGKDDPNSLYTMPVFLPDGIHFFYLRQALADEASSGVYLATLSEPVGQRVLADRSSVVYTPPASAGARAHLLFLRESTLMAQPVDDASLQPVGDPFPVVARASESATPPQVAASAAADGTLVYLAGRSGVSQLTWLDRTGKELGKVGPPADQVGVAMSPDGHAVVTRRRHPTGSAFWLYDLTRGSESRLSPPGPQEGGNVIWSADNSTIWFSMPTGPDGSGLYQKDLKGSSLQLVEKRDTAQRPKGPSDWSRDGRFVVYTQDDPKTQADIWYFPVDSGKPGAKPIKLLGSDAIESQGQLSPDGKWLAYCSNDAGKFEVYVRPFPTGPGVWKVSVQDSAREPRWRSDGKELFFTSVSSLLERTLMAVPVEPDGRGGLRIGPSQRLFEVRAVMILPQGNVFSYSPHPDGQRFLVNALVETGEPTVNVITNWQHAVTQESRRR